MKYYDILELNPEASQAEIEEAYKQKVKETHPDQSDHPNAAQQFIQVKEAYDVLSDPDQRKSYDQHGVSGAESGSASATQSTTAADAEGVGWRAYTRDSDNADEMWEGVQQQSEKPPTVDEIGSSRVIAAIGNMIAAVTGAVLGLVLIMYPLSWLQGESFSIILILFGMLVFVLVLGGVEKFLGTYRQLLPI